MKSLVLKICVVGDDEIGKEAFIKFFIGKEAFIKTSLTKSPVPTSQKRDTRKTLGVQLYFKEISINTDKGMRDYVIQLWELTGEERFKFLYPKFFKGTNGILLFFDLANRESFLHLTDWITLLEQDLANTLAKDVPLLLVGNKSDPEKSAIFPKEFDDFIRKHKLPYIETSTITKEGIIDSFYGISSLIVGVDVQSEFFISEKTDFRPSISPPPISSSVTSFTPQDIHNLTQQLITEFDKKIDIKIEEKLAIHSNKVNVTKADAIQYQESDFICDRALNILHISDIQEGRFGIKEDISGVDELYSNYLADLKSKLEIIHRKNKIDILVISGDLVSTGAKEEYDNLTNEFVPILNDIFLKGRNIVPKDRWIIVPGNHDVEWGKGNARFNNFIQFCQENGFHHYKLNKPDSIYSRIVCKDKNSGNVIGVMGLNSCLAILDEDSRNRSNISNSYFSSFSEDWHEDFREIPKMMVCHHTLYAIKNDKFDHALNKLKDNNVLVALAGDIHKTESIADEISKIRCIPAGTIAAKKSERSVGIDEVSRQFNLIKINLQSGYIKWYTHLFEGTWRKIKNESFYLDHSSFSKKV